MLAPAVLLAVLAVTCEQSVEPVQVTADRTPPAIASWSPLTDAEAPPFTDIEIEFNEAVDPATVTIARFMVVAGGSEWPGTVRHAGDGRRYTFDPLGLLPDTGSVQVTIAAGIADLAGNTMVSAHSWSFRPVWRAGTPIAPTPDDGADEIELRRDLSWQVIDEAPVDSFTVRLGLPGALAPVCREITAPTCWVGPLDCGKTYHWQVVAHAGDDTLNGPLWAFSTWTPPGPDNQVPSVPVQPQPADSAEAVWPDVTLTWDGGADPDGDPVTFAVHFGTSTEPPLVATVSEPRYDPPRNLVSNTTYWWRVIADDSLCGRTAGPLWIFSTGVINQAPTAPANPDPPDGASRIAPDAVLTWDASSDPEGDDVLYDVYFGTIEEPLPLVALGITEPRFAPFDPPAEIPYTPGVTHRWWIEARDTLDHARQGPEWSFTNNQLPRPPCAPFPDSAATDVTTPVTLAWGCGDDPDEQSVNYLVFFGADQEPPYLGETAPDEPSYPLSPMQTARGTWYWQVTTVDPHGLTAPGTVWWFEVPNQPPLAFRYASPDSDTTFTGTSFSVAFSWEEAIDPDADEVRYELWVGEGAPTNLFETTEALESVPWGGFVHGRWYWRIKAIDEFDAVREGPVWTLDVNRLPDPPCQPTPGSGTVVSSPITLDWECAGDPDGDRIGYDIHIGRQDQGEPPYWDSLELGEQPPVEFGPATPGTWHWRIIPVDELGERREGPLWTFRVNEPPPAVPSPGDGDSVDQQ